MIEARNWERMWELYEDVAARPAEDWATYLDSVCPDDAELRSQVWDLLLQGDPPSDYLEQGPEYSDRGEAEQDLLIGSHFGPYRIGTRIGRGGMGVVYEALQESPVKRRVALKLIRRGLKTRELVARFESERQALAILSHPNIAKIFDVGTTGDDHPYFAMEYVDGKTITRFCDDEHLTLRQRLELFVQICEAVQHAHQKGILHRDLKPTNIVVTRDSTGEDSKPRPIIIDFGVAKLLDAELKGATAHTRVGSLIGTPEYMSPEQWELAADVDTRTDVYSLGVILFELLTGTLPFELRDKPFLEAWKIQNECEPERPSTRVSTVDPDTAAQLAEYRGLDLDTLTRELSGDLDWIVMKAIEKEPARRYASASELAADIDRHLNHIPVEAGPPSRLYRSKKFIRRHRVAVSASIATTVALVAGLISTAWMAREALAARDQARQEAAVAEATSSFLEEMLAAPNPFGTGSSYGVDTRVVEVLDTAAQRLDTQFEGQPLVEARLRRSLAKTYYGMGQFEAAERQNRVALTLQRAHLGDDHPETLRTMLGLSTALRMLHRFEPTDEIEEILIRVYETARRTLGPGDRLTTDSQIALVQYLGGSGDEAEARRVAKEGITLLSRELDGELLDPQPPTLFYHLMMPAAIESPAERVNLLRRLYEHRSKSLGPDHEITLETRGILAQAETKWGDPRAAAELYRTLVEDEKQVASLDRETLSNYLFWYAEALRRAAETDKAIPYLKRSLELTAERTGRENYWYVQDKLLLDRLLLETGRVGEAEASLHQSRQTINRFAPDDPGLLWLVRYLLGRTLVASGRYDEAEAELLSSLDVGRRLRAPSIETRIVDALIELYEAWGRTDDAARFREIRASLPEPDRG